MKKIIIMSLCLVILLFDVDARKMNVGSKSSGRSMSRKTNYNPRPAPTSFSNPQTSAPKPTLFGWQEKPSHNSQTYASSKQSNPSSGQSHTYPSSHSYPSSQTGLSGNSPAKQPPTYQESIQRNGSPQQTAQRPASQTNNPSSHSYPSSNGMSGNAGSVGYPQSGGLSGSGSVPAHNYGNNYPQPGGAAGTGVGYPQGSGVAGAGGLPPPYSGYKTGGSYPSQGVGNSYHPPQGPPPSYSGYGGYGNHGSYSPGYINPQLPGYFGNYGGNRGFGGVTRSTSALTGLGIAGAGVGTILTGLALWNLARSTGHHHHTVIYNNHGQPVAVTPANGTETNVDPILNNLVNCTLTISTDNATEVLAIPCAIATSFTPEAEIKDENSGSNKVDNTKCTVTVVTKNGKEFMTTIPCSILLNSAAENNVTEPQLIENGSDNLNTSFLAPNDMLFANQPSAFTLDDGNKVIEPGVTQNCTSGIETGETRDPINPCFAVKHDLTVNPLKTSISTESTLPENKKDI